MTLFSGLIVLLAQAAWSAGAGAHTRFSASSAYKLASLYRARTGHHPGPRAHTSIVGGEYASDVDFPYAAFIIYFDQAGDPQQGCTGTVISPNVVLSAAHCLIDEDSWQPLDPSGFRVVTGVADWSDESARQVSAVSQVIAHPDFNLPSDNADAGLLVLAQPTSSPAVRLASGGERYLYTAGMPALIAGWGLHESGELDANLRWAQTTVQGWGYCGDSYEDFDGFWQTCAVQAPGFSSGTCSGDSGGPLLTLDADRHPVEIGVIDMGPKDCSETTSPSIFARANVLLGWASASVASVAAPGQPPMAAAPSRPVPPTLDFSAAGSYARTMIHERTHKRVRAQSSCLRVNAWKLQCRLSWRAASVSYTANGTFWHYLQGSRAYWRYDFKGTSAKAVCGPSRCRVVRRAFRWR